MFATVDKIKDVARQTPERPAIREHERTLTYHELDVQSTRLAVRLLDCGIVEGDVVACFKESMTCYALVALGCIKIGAAFIFLDIKEDMAKITHGLDHSQAKIIVTDGPEAEKFAKDLGRGAIALKSDGEVVELRDLPEVKSSALTHIERTSGSTGVSKLVAVTQEAQDHYTELQKTQGALNSDDVIALLGELWLHTFFAGLKVGASFEVYNLKTQGAAGFPEWMRSRRISVIQTYVAAFRALCEASNAVLPDLKNVRLCGEALFRSDVDAFHALCLPGARLSNFYASTECNFMAQYTHKHGDEMPFKTMPAGKTAPGGVTDIVDENLQILPQGATGHIIHRSPFVSIGYIRDVEKTKGVFWGEENGIYAVRTGDLGFFDKDNRLHISGRADDQVKIRGYAVRYSDVEQTAAKFSGIEFVAVTSFVSPRGVRQLSCCYTTAPGNSVIEADLRRFLHDNLPAYMVPNYLIELDELPRTRTGKILRRALPDPLAIKGPSRISAREGACEMEKTIAQIWGAVLGHENFDLDDDFFDIGGDSLQAMTMMITIEKKEKRRLGYESLIVHGASVRQISARLTAASDQGTGEIIELKQGRGAVPIYILPVVNGEFSDWLYLLNGMERHGTVYGVHVRDIVSRRVFEKNTIAQLAEFSGQSILDMNPDGPYILGGFSAGTQLAFETAKFIEAKGGKVIGLILMDAPVVKYEPYRRTWKWRRILGPLIKRGEIGVSINRARHIFGRVPAQELHIADDAAFWAYKPEPAPISNVLMVSCDEENPDADEKISHWQALVGGQAEVWTVGGNHTHMMRDPNVGILARRLEDWLDDMRPV